MIYKRFEDIVKADIDALVESEVREMRTLDYKETLPGGGRDDKKEFIADVTSFANAGGGDLVYGVRDRRNEKGNSTGLPEVCGLGDINADQEILRLENMIRDGTDPRVPGVQIKAIDGFEGGPVILLRIRQSWIGPHMSTLNWRFYSRTSSGKQALLSSEIRSAFELSGRLTDKVRQFRDERMARIVAKETPS